MKLPISLRILNSFAVALFGAFAVFQYNDIDPAVYHRASSLDAALWLGFYALVSALFALTLIRRSASPWLLLVGAVACLAKMGQTGWGLWINIFGQEEFTMMQVSMSAEDPRVELSREFFGALLALAAVMLLWWERRKFTADLPSPAGKSSSSPPGIREESDES